MDAASSRSGSSLYILGGGCVDAFLPIFATIGLNDHAQTQRSNGPQGQILGVATLFQEVGSAEVQLRKAATIPMDSWESRVQQLGNESETTNPNLSLDTSKGRSKITPPRSIDSQECLSTDLQAIYCISNLVYALDSGVHIGFESSRCCLSRAKNPISRMLMLAC